jgi:hypothetical protein
MNPNAARCTRFQTSAKKWAADAGGRPEMTKRIMSDEFEGLDATDKAGTGTTLNRCRALATKIANELRNKRPEHFIDKLSLADVHASLERVAWVLEQKTAKGKERSRRRPGACLHFMR